MYTAYRLSRIYGRIPIATEALVDNVMSRVDYEDTSDAPLTLGRHRPRRHRRRWTERYESAVAEIVRRTRAKHGTLEHNADNEAMVSKTIRDMLTDSDVRASDIDAIYPIAVAMVFVKTEAQLAALQVLSTSEATARRVESGKHWLSVQTIRSFVDSWVGGRPGVR